jgi:hypothetical protein
MLYYAQPILLRDLKFLIMKCVGAPVKYFLATQ